MKKLGLILVMAMLLVGCIVVPTPEIIIVTATFEPTEIPTNTPSPTPTLVSTATPAFDAWKCGSAWKQLEVSKGEEDWTVNQILNSEWPPDSIGFIIKDCIENGWIDWRIMPINTSTPTLVWIQKAKATEVATKETRASTPVPPTNVPPTVVQPTITPHLDDGFVCSTRTRTIVDGCCLSGYRDNDGSCHGNMTNLSLCIEDDCCYFVGVCE